MLADMLQALAHEPAILDTTQPVKDMPLHERLAFQASQAMTGPLHLAPFSLEEEESIESAGKPFAKSLLTYGRQKVDSHEGTIFQFHSSVPVRAGHSKLLYRMAVESRSNGKSNTDLKQSHAPSFMTSLLPVSQTVWKNLAERYFHHVMSADLMEKQSEQSKRTVAGETVL